VLYSHSYEERCAADGATSVTDPETVPGLTPSGTEVDGFAVENDRAMHFSYEPSASVHLAPPLRAGTRWA
jgi:hypothetical protein